MAETGLWENRSPRVFRSKPLFSFLPASPTKHMNVTFNRILPFIFVSVIYAITHYLLARGLAYETNPFTLALNPLTIPLPYLVQAFFIWVSERLSNCFSPKWRRLVAYTPTIALIPNLINDLSVLILIWLST